MGAGVIPFAVLNEEIRFLFHKTFSGRRAGYLVDFGGGGREGESYRDTAIREFIEETETMFFSDRVADAVRSDRRVSEQIPRMESLFDRTLSACPSCWCQRAPGSKVPPKDWRTFFIEFDYRDVEDMNREWRSEDAWRFSKPRHLLWVSADELLEIYRHEPERLWKRVRQLQGAEETILDIVRGFPR
ncbi:MAG: hypothetical protein U9R74_16450 [Pseudomonadota bacterium]|nr:hypothetical protein [Pseudomonadota bacterium]